MAWVAIWASSMAVRAGDSHPLLLRTSTQAWIRRIAFERVCIHVCGMNVCGGEREREGGRGEGGGEREGGREGGREQKMESLDYLPLSRDLIKRKPL